MSTCYQCQLHIIVRQGLVAHPQHALSSKLMTGYFGVLSFYLNGSYEDARAFLFNLKVFTVAYSIGWYKSYASLPWIMTHRMYPEEDRRKVGITENLVRLSLGLEDPEDLIRDMDQAFSAITHAAENDTVTPNGIVK